MPECAVGDGGRGAVSLFGKRALDRADDEPAHDARLAEADLGLGGMDIDVHLVARKFEEECRHRLPVMEQEVAVGTSERTLEKLVLHRPAIDTEILVAGVTAGEGGQPHQPPKADGLPFGIEFDGVLAGIAAEQPCGPVERPVLPMLRLIANLTSNAIKHTAAGEVRVAAGPAEGAAAFVEVADTGPGLSAEDLARLRQPGIKGEASEGSGWGLAIVDDLAAKLGATVEFHTAPGAGMRVRILI